MWRWMKRSSTEIICTDVFLLWQTGLNTVHMRKTRTARVTNAKRYMSSFSQRPYETWKIIEESIQPYLNKLPRLQREFSWKIC